MKKAMSDQFNWIFVIIVGAVILLFFFSMIQKQQSITIAKTDASIIRQVETIISVAGSEKETITTKELPNIDITLQCKKRGTTCDCNYKSGTMDRPYDDKIIYAPRKITGTQVHIWTKTWEQPFRITNMVYATNDRHQYIIVKNGNQNLHDSLRKIIPERINVEYVNDLNDVNNIPNNNYESVTIMILSPPQGTLTTPQQFSGITKFVVVNEGANKVNIGSDAYIYIGTPQIIGALFSADKEMYECNTRKAFERLTSTTEIQKKRIENINTNFTSTQPPTTRPCSTLYTTFPAVISPAVAGTVGALDAIKNAAETLRKNISITQSTHAQTIKEYNDPIKGANEKMVLNGCPSIY